MLVVDRPPMRHNIDASMPEPDEGCHLLLRSGMIRAFLTVRWAVSGGGCCRPTTRLTLQRIVHAAETGRAWYFGLKSGRWTVSVLLGISWWLEMRMDLCGIGYFHPKMI